MQVGHIYQYKTRPNEAQSTFVVLKIDNVKGHSVASIAVVGLSVKSKSSLDGVAKEIGHFPISLESLMASSPVDTGRTQKVTWPNDGYDQWMNAVKLGKAGFWTKTLSECIDAMESVIEK